MPLWTGWKYKPPQGTPLDRTHGLCQGLVAFYPMNEGAGPTLNNANDLAAGLGLTATGFSTTNPWSHGIGGPGLNCNSAGYGAVATIPASWQMAWPISVAVAFTVLGTQADNSNLIGLIYDDANSNPYEVIELSISPSLNSIECSWNSGGSYAGETDLLTTSTGTTYVCTFTITSGTQVVYANGASIYSGTTSLSNPTYSTTAQIAIGNYVGVSRNSNCLFYWGAVWNRGADGSGARAPDVVGTLAVADVRPAVPVLVRRYGIVDDVRLFRRQRRRHRERPDLTVRLRVPDRCRQFPPSSLRFRHPDRRRKRRRRYDHRRYIDRR